MSKREQYGADTYRCPDCGCECRREEVDCEAGYQYGPWTCTACPWNENIELSRLGLDPEVIGDEFSMKETDYE